MSFVRGAGAALVGMTLVLSASACSNDDSGPLPAADVVATAAPSATPTPTPTPAPHQFTVVASGDLLIHPGVWWRAEREAKNTSARYDFFPALSALEPLISGADLAICHLEGAMGAAGSEPQGFPLFNNPPELAAAVAKLGYDTCSTASNHGIDQGEAGVNTTLAALDAAGVAHVGTARNADEDKPVLLDANGVTVAHLSYTYGHNNARPADKPWLINTLADDSILDDARAARAAGAEVVIASLHWGVEFLTNPTPDQISLATELMDSGEIDLVIGHHAHVVQPIEAFGDRFVVYGLGNVISALSHDFANGASREGIVPKFTFTRDGERWKVTDIEVTPTYVSPVGGLHTADVATDLERRPAGEDLARLTRARDRTVATVYSRGVDDAVVRVR